MSARRPDGRVGAIAPLGRTTRGPRMVLRVAFERVERAFDRCFGPALNPLGNLGALGFFFFWITTVTGAYLYVVFDTSVAGAYASVERLTVAQWYLGGVMRSLHRYASDALVIVALTHLARELSLDRHRGVRWFSWVTGVPILWLIYASGITGYWLVWDKLAQYVAIATAEWLDWLPIFGEPIARNFLAPGSLNDRFFTLLIFLHIAVPLILVFMLWVHLQRISRPRINPPRRLAAMTLAALVALSLWRPATSQGPADLGSVPAVVDLDWFYLALYPLFDIASLGAAWALVGLGTALMLALPWLPPLRKPPLAAVDLEHCNGCARCAEDCPYAAIEMTARTDGRPFAKQPLVDPSLCLGCGICVGACPSSTPFRQASGLETGIGLPDLPLSVLRDQIHAASAACRGSRRIVAIGCRHGVPVGALAEEGIGSLVLPCVAMAPPALLDYALSRNLADGVLVAGCSPSACYHRLGVEWMEARIAGAREPRLRKRVPRERIAVVWAGPSEGVRLAHEARSFALRLAAMPPVQVREPVMVAEDAEMEPQA